MTTTDSLTTTTSAVTAMKPQVLVQSSKVNDAVSFYKSAFGAEEVNIVTHPKRKADQEVPMIVSAEVKIGDSVFIISDDSSATGKEISTGIVFWLETEADIEAAVEKAVKAGAIAVKGELTQGEGACVDGREAKLKDPYGIAWNIYTPAAKKSADVEA